MKRAIGTLLLILTSTLVGGPAEASGWGSTVTVTGVYSTASGGAYVNTSGNQNIDSCSNGSHYLYLDTTQPNFRELYATLLAALTTGSTVSLYYNGCSGGTPLITALAMPVVW